MSDGEKHEFTIHEYDALRREIESYFSELRKLEVYAALAIALVYYFLITLERSPTPAPINVPIWAWALPILFPFLAFLRALAFSGQIGLIADYIRQVEAYYARTPLGWEHRDKRGWMLARTNLIFVGVLVLVTVAVFIWRYKLH